MLMVLAQESANAHEMLVTSAAAIAAGTFLLLLARRTGLPSLVLLLAGGVLLGPQVLGVVRPSSMGDGLLVVVELAVGLILFEGGLTLERSGYRSAPAMIRRLLSIGVLATWLGTALVIRLVAGTEWSQAIIASSLVIVTGPTVIAPLLKRVRITARLHNILYWESILIEPIGVFIAVLCFEWQVGHAGAEALTNLAERIAVGAAAGAGGGFLIGLAMRRGVIPRDMVNIFGLAGAVLVFGVSESVIPKAGLLAVAVAGFVVGLSATTAVKQLRSFKAELTNLLIGTLFVLLTARLNFGQFQDFGARGVAVVALVMFAVRPLSIALCSIGLDLSPRERGFLAWIAPRGIVAASMASLFAISLEERGVTDARFVETFTYSVILATIIVQAVTAGAVSRLLKVDQPEPTGWLIIGVHALSERIARFIEQVAGRTAILIDSNARAVHEARSAGSTAIVADARETDLLDRHGLTSIGYLLALTDNEDLNARICERWGPVVGHDHVFRCSWGRTGLDEDEDGTTGTAVWPSLPRPTLIAAELTRGEATIAEVHQKGELPAGAVALARAAPGTFVLDPDPEARGIDDETKVLYIRRRADYLLRSIRPDLVLTAETTTLRELFEQMIDRMVRIHPKLPRDATVAELLQRESSFPSVIGEGVAVPHAYSGAIDQRLCGIARVHGGVAFPAGGGPVQLAFLVISPQGDPEGHLATLAEIARLVSVPENRARLLDAASPLEVVHVVRQRGPG